MDAYVNDFYIKLKSSGCVERGVVFERFQNELRMLSFQNMIQHKKFVTTNEFANHIFLVSKF